MSECPFRSSSLCQKLDSLVLDYFETLENISVLRMQLDASLKDGFLQMAKARYSMGNKRVTALQYDVREMTAIKRVQSQVEPNRGIHGFSLESISLVNEAPPSESRGAQIRVRASDDVVVADRDEFVGDGDDDQDEDCPLIEASRATRTDSAPVQPRIASDPAPPLAVPKDPLKWFGLLVPQALKHSQLSFQRSLTVVCELASLQAKLQKITAEYTAAESEVVKTEDSGDAERET